MKLYITGGGTGGHVTPGLAIARYFKMNHPDAEIRFAGTAGGIESKLVPREGYPLDTFEIRGLRRKLSPSGIAYNLKTLQMSSAALKNAKKLLRENRPDCVIGCGGYASFPVVRAAQSLGIPTVLLEVNAFPGVTTKMLAKKADRVLICFEEARKTLGHDQKVVLTGSPVRGEILAADRAEARKRLGLADDEQYVISFWGSMGAKYMNEHMAEMLALECKENVQWRHLHATGAAASKWLPELVKKAGVNLEDHPNIGVTEYIYDMALQLAAADLVLCRAGAATIGELCAVGVPSIMVPSPYVAENHQEKNARAVEAVGGCRVLLEKDASGKKLLEMTRALLGDRANCEKMRVCARTLENSNADEKIYREILAAMGK